MMGQQDLPPGYRFSPTDEELVMHYLKKKACGEDFHNGVITEVDIYKHEPWELPEVSAVPSPDPVWFFFNAQDKRHSRTSRINRTTGKGYWKATGKDRKILCGARLVGIKKSLIYYEGRAPSGKRTDWIMHEYKLDEEFERKSKVVCFTTLCRIRKKGGPGPRNGEQFGASVRAEHNDLEEDVEEDVDEKPLTLLDTKLEPSASRVPHPMEAEVQEGVVLQDGHKEGSASNDLSHAEGLDTNTEQDLHAFLEEWLANDAEATYIEPEMGSSEMQSFVHDSFLPTSGEEQLLEELRHLADGGQMYACDVPPAYKDGGLWHFADGGQMYASDLPPVYNDTVVNGDFIELGDMNSPLDGFVMRSPLHSSYYMTEEKPEALFAPLSEVEDIGASSELLHSQGSAPRRVRLQVSPQCAPPLNGDLHRQMRTSPTTELLPEVQGGSTDLNIQIIGGPTIHSITSSSSGSNGDSEEIRDVVESSQLSFLSKQPYMVRKCEEVTPPVFVAAMAGSQHEGGACSSDGNRVISEEFVSSISLQNTGSGLQGESGNCESGLRRGPFFKAGKRVQEAGVDCEAELDSAVMRGFGSMRRSALLPSATFPSNRNGVLGELASKMGALNLGRRFAQLESNLSTRFNDRVFALGKPVTQIVPYSDHANPYRSLRRGALSSLLRLVTIVFLLLLLLIGIHMIAKYVLSTRS